MKQVDKQLIARLLARYMEGQTTIEEEDMLNAYFHASHPIPEEWETYRRMFCFYDTEHCVESNHTQNGSIWKWAVAASLILLVGVATWLWQQNEQAQGQPQLAQRTEKVSVEKQSREKGPVANVENAEMTVCGHVSTPVAKRASRKGISEMLVPELTDSAEMVVPSETDGSLYKRDLSGFGQSSANVAAADRQGKRGDATADATAWYGGRCAGPEHRLVW